MKSKAPRDRSGKRSAQLDDPFAVTSTGRVLLNVQNFDDVDSLDSALHRAVEEGNAIFIGVAMRRGEIRDALEHLSDVVYESAWSVIGKRQRRSG